MRYQVCYVLLQLCWCPVGAAAEQHTTLACRRAAHAVPDAHNTLANTGGQCVRSQARA